MTEPPDPPRLASPSSGGEPRWPPSQRALEYDKTAPLSFRLVAMFAGGGVLLALTTVVLAIAHS